MTIDEIEEKFKDFRSGVRVSMLIDRSVGNTNKGSKRWVNKIISTNEDEWRRSIVKLLALQNYMGDPNVRLYSCLNDRNMDYAVRLFKTAQIFSEGRGDFEFYSRINDKFCSCLMKPQCRNNKLFLLDWDNPRYDEFVENFLNNTELKVYLNYKTPNGHHAVTDPFDVNWTKGLIDLDVKNDGLLLINALDYHNKDLK